MRPISLVLLALTGCAGSPCGDDVQFAPFAADAFEPLCAGDSLAIRAFQESYLVDLNIQFRGIAGEGAVAGAWELTIDRESYLEDGQPEVPSYLTDDGWWRVHAMLWLDTLTPEQASGLEGLPVELSATFTNAQGQEVDGADALIVALTE